MSDNEKTRWMRPIDEEYGPWEEAGRVITMPDGRYVSDPLESSLREAGYLPEKDDPPETDESHVAYPIGWEERDGYAVRIYEIMELPPPPPRKWSSLAIKRTLVAAGRWNDVKSMLVAADKYDDFIMADYIAEDDDDFLAARAQAVQIYGEESVAELIDSIPEDVG